MDKPDLDQLLIEKGLNRSDLIKRCDVNKSTVSRWAERGVPLQRVPVVERATGIPRERLRPDFAWEAV